MKLEHRLANGNAVSREAPVALPSERGYSLIAVLSGDAYCQLGKRSLHLSADSCIMISPALAGSFLLSQPQQANILHVYFTEGYIACFSEKVGFSIEALSSAGCFDALYALTNDMRLNLMHLLRHLERNGGRQELLNEYLEHSLLTYYTMFRKEVLLRKDRLRFAKETTRTEVMKRLNDAREYLNSNYDQPVSLKAAADIACLSVNHFLRTFKEAYGISPHQYLIQLRLRRARHLLRHTGYALNQIVSMVGFESPSSFIRLFKSTYTTTPLQYRSGLIKQC